MNTRSIRLRSLLVLRLKLRTAAFRALSLLGRLQVPYARRGCPLLALSRPVCGDRRRHLCPERERDNRVHL